MEKIAVAAPCRHPEYQMEHDGPFPYRLACASCGKTIKCYSKECEDEQE